MNQLEEVQLLSQQVCILLQLQSSCRKLPLPLNSDELKILPHMMPVTIYIRTWQCCRYVCTIMYTILWYDLIIEDA